MGWGGVEWGGAVPSAEGLNKFTRVRNTQQPVETPDDAIKNYGAVYAICDPVLTHGITALENI